tara:strand:+ start:124 stop:582 length:459 start_codon:yes stop_codon:yes gene_type:complete
VLRATTSPKTLLFLSLCRPRRRNFNGGIEREEEEKEKRRYRYRGEDNVFVDEVVGTRGGPTLREAANAMLLIPFLPFFSFEEEISFFCFCGLLFLFFSSNDISIAAHLISKKQKRRLLSKAKHKKMPQATGKDLSLYVLQQLNPIPRPLHKN